MTEDARRSAGGEADESARTGSRTELARLPSVEILLQLADTKGLSGLHGRARVTAACRKELEAWRGRLLADAAAQAPGRESILAAVTHRLASDDRSTLRAVFNLTGTVLHTNLGRASLPDSALAAVAAVARGASTLEYDLERGARGERDTHVERLLCELTGAEAATVVNNNAAAVLLVLNTLALRRDVLVSRGELVEIGGSFRVPEIMARAGARLREVGTTNRTHARDYADALTPRTALLMRVHPSNYRIEGFTAAVSDAELSRIAHGAGLPFVSDLGSGSLVDLSDFGLPHEPTAAEVIAAGADLVTFSGDKLLGGPQAGLIVGRRDLVERLRRNPLKRALRCDKMTIAALGEVLRLYRNPERLEADLPTLRLLCRPAAEIADMAERLAIPVAEALGELAAVERIACSSQIGSGALPAALLPSAGLRLTGTRCFSARRIAEEFRRLPIPVIGRMEAGGLVLDLRCLEDEAGFRTNLASFPRHLGKAQGGAP